MFYEKIGGTMAMIDMAKTFLLELKKADFEFFFGNKILTSEDLSFNTNETSAEAMFAHFSPSVIMDRLKKVSANRSLLRRIGGVAVRIGRLKLTMSRMPETYDRAAVAKWSEKLDKMFSEKAAD